MPQCRDLRFILWRQLQQQQGKLESEKAACSVCERDPGFDYMEVDHIVPRSLGGEHVEENLQLPCSHCDRSKGNKLMGQWLKERDQLATLISEAVKSE